MMQTILRTATCALAAHFCLSAGIADAQQQPMGDNIVVASTSAAVNQWQGAADRGVSSAQYLIGLYYSRGQGGLRRDYVKAYKWFRVSADSHPGSRKNLELLSLKMRPGQISLAEMMATDWLRAHGK